MYTDIFVYVSFFCFRIISCDFYNHFWLLSMAWHISLLVIIALSPHPVLVCLIVGVITSYEFCNVNYVFLNMILLLIKYDYICFYLLHEEPCNVDVANKPLLLFIVYIIV